MARLPAKLGGIVVDANILFGALLRDSTNRNLMLHGNLDLHAPEWLWDELTRNREFLVKKSHERRLRLTH
jgi:predicted nucleic acid-binding protein